MRISDWSSDVYSSDLNRLRIAPPQPGTGYGFGVARAAARVDALAHAAVIAEERLAGLAHDTHEIFIRLHFSEVRCLDSVGPFRPSRCALGEPLRHRRALGDVEQPARIGHAQRPGRHQHPPDDGEERSEEHTSELQ